MKVTVAFTGASGMPYGARLLDQLHVPHTLGPRWGESIAPRTHSA